MKSVRSILLQLSSNVPYAAGSYVLSLVYGSKTLRRLFFRSREKVVRRYLDAVGSGADAEEVLCQSLVSGKFVAWRLTAISRADDECVDKWL